MRAITDFVHVFLERRDILIIPFPAILCVRAGDPKMAIPFKIAAEDTRSCLTSD